jgi:hypothetical protein
MDKYNIWDILDSCRNNANRIGQKETESSFPYTEREAVEFAFNRLRPLFIEYGLMKEEKNNEQRFDI